MTSVAETSADVLTKDVDDAADMAQRQLDQLRSIRQELLAPHFADLAKRVDDDIEQVRARLDELHGIRRELARLLGDVSFNQACVQ